MSVNFQFTVAGEKQVARSIERFAEHVSDLRPAWDNIARDFALVEQKQFNQAGIGPSGKWAPLSESVAKRKGGRPIMVQSGTLKGSLTKRPFGVEKIQKLSLMMGTDVEYAIYHQSLAPRRRLPRRPVIDLDDASKRRWMKYIQRHLVELARGTPQ